MGVFKEWKSEILILLREPIDARCIKVKTYLDDRDEKLNPVNNAEFRNKVKDFIKVTERTEIYEYDAIGNRLEENISDWRSVNRNYSYYLNPNRLKSNEKYTFYYDDNGSMIRKVSAEDAWEYEYDLLDRLINVTRNGTSVAIYTYNADGLRLKKENSEKEIYYVYNQGDQIICEQENDTIYEYIYVGGRHFARVDTNRVTDEPSTYFYHSDHLGSTVMVTNEAGKIAWTAEYTPFGSISMAEGLMEKTVKFTGKDLDEDTGLYYYNARWYDQELGRFISEDIAKDGTNFYSYTKNNPLVNVDPDGRIVISTLLFKAGTADLLAQLAFSYFFNPEVKSIDDAISQVNWWQVARSSAESMIPWKVPGGRWGKAAVTASLDVVVNYTDALTKGEDYLVEQAIADFAVGYIGDVGGEYLGDLINKYGSE